MRFLIVEDEPMIAMLVEDFLAVLGHEVAATADTIPSALEAIDTAAFDAAILDVNLGSVKIWPLADRLVEDRVPFIFASGGLEVDQEERFASVPVVTKPFSLTTLGAALAKLSTDA